MLRWDLMSAHTGDTDPIIETITASVREALTRLKQRPGKPGGQKLVVHGESMDWPCALAQRLNGQLLEGTVNATTNPTLTLPSLGREQFTGHRPSAER